MGSLQIGPPSLRAPPHVRHFSGMQFFALIIFEVNPRSFVSSAAPAFSFAFSDLVFLSCSYSSNPIFLEVETFTLDALVDVRVARERLVAFFGAFPDSDKEADVKVDC